MRSGRVLIGSLGKSAVDSVHRRPMAYMNPVRLKLIPEFPDHNIERQILSDVIEQVAVGSLIINIAVNICRLP